MLSKLKPAAGVSRIFDSAILDKSAVPLCVAVPASLPSFDFGVKMEKRSAYSCVKGVSTGVSSADLASSLLIKKATQECSKCKNDR